MQLHASMKPCNIERVAEHRKASIAFLQLWLGKLQCSFKF